MKNIILWCLVMALQIVVPTRVATSKGIHASLEDKERTIIIVLSCNISAFSSLTSGIDASLSINNSSCSCIESNSFLERKSLENSKNVAFLCKIPSAKIGNNFEVYFIPNHTLSSIILIISTQNLTMSQHVLELGMIKGRNTKQSELKVVDLNCSTHLNYCTQCKFCKILNKYLNKYYLTSSKHKRRHIGKRILLHMQKMFYTLKLCGGNKNKHTFSHVINLRKKNRLKRDSNKQSVDFQDHREMDHRIITRNFSLVNSSSAYIIELFKKEQMKKQLEREAESAALCLVFISGLMLFCIWYLRGFHNRNTKYREVTFHDSSHILTVKEVLFRKRHYLPMFNRDDGFEEVYVHDCGNDP